MIKSSDIVTVGTSSHPELPNPSEITVVDNRVGRFGKHELEVTAGRLVLFMKERKAGLWDSFTLEELKEFYIVSCWKPNMMLDGLIGVYCDLGGQVPELCGPFSTETFLVNILGGRFVVTGQFVQRCLLK